MQIEERKVEDMNAREQESDIIDSHTMMGDKQKESIFKALETDPSKLVIKNHIATGGFGSVYKGVYGGKEVAIKVLDLVDDDEGATLWNVFVREVLIWNNLDHPNIAKFIGATKGIADLSINKRGRGKSRIPRMACCMAAEYVHGGNLRAYLRRHRVRKLPLDVVVRLALDVARGLCYLHSQKIVHRDVKPENILLDKETKQVKIIDFGISTFETLNPSDQLTAQIGTAGYMAPEVVSGGWGNHKCDVFSFGICLWEMYCCDKPDCSSSYRPVIPESCPKDLAKLMERCWNADPERRPEMSEVVRILEAMGTSRLAERTNVLDDQLMKGCFCF